MKLLKEIQLQFVGRQDKKATFMRHFPGDLQEQDGAISAVEGTAYLTSTISFGLRNPILLFTMCCTPRVIAMHSNLPCNDLRDEESHSSAVVTKREVHLHTIDLASAECYQ